MFWRILSCQLSSQNVTTPNDCNTSNLWKMSCAVKIWSNPWKLIMMPNYGWNEPKCQEREMFMCFLFILSDKILIYVQFLILLWSKRLNALDFKKFKLSCKTTKLNYNFDVCALQCVKCTHVILLHTSCSLYCECFNRSVCNIIQQENI